MEEDNTLTKHLSQKDPIISLYAEEEIEDVSTTSSVTKSNTVITGQVSEVSSTSEDNYQVPSTSSKSAFMDLYEEDIFNTDSENVNNAEKDTSASDAAGTKKRKPGLLLLGEYADSGNDTEEEALNALKVRQDKSKETLENASSKDAGSEDVVSETVINENKPLETSAESDMTKVFEELPLTVGKDSSLAEEKVEDKNDSDSHAMQDTRQAKLERSVSKEEGQISAESDSSDSEQSSEDRKDSIKQKDSKKDKSKKKDKKKKKKKRKKQKHSGDKKDSDVTGDEKKVRKSVRGRSRESSEKRRFSKHSRSKSQDRSKDRSKDRSSRHRVHSRSRSQDKWKQSRYVREKSRRSRSRSSSRRRSAPNRNKDFKSRIRSPKRSVSPRNRRREREDKWSSTSRSRRDSPSKRKRKVSRSRSPLKRRERSPEHRRSRSPNKRSYSPDKRRRTSPEKSPRESSPSRNEKSARKRERKQSQSTPVKAAHRTSSASDSLDSGHFTNIPLSKTNKPEESEPDSNEPVKKPSPISEKKSEPSVPPKAVTDVEKQFSPMYSPEKPWEDEFDFVFTEHLSPRQGTEKSMEDVLFGSEAKTPDFKRPITVESKKNKGEPVTKKEEKKEEKVKTGREKNVPQKEENQDGSSRIQQASSDTAESAIKANGQNISASKTAEVAKTVFEDKPDQLGKRNSDNESLQASINTNKSAFMQSKLEVIPFLDEAPSTQPPVGSSTAHPAKSQVDIKGSSPLAGTGKKQNELQTAKDIIQASITRINKAPKNVNVSPMDMEMSSPEGDIIDRMNEEFWRQQQQQPVGMNQAEVEGRQSREGFTVESEGNEQCSFEEPYEPESGLIIGEEYEDLNEIADPKERRKKEKQQQKEKTKVQELIDKLHRQARVEEEVKHVLKAYYKHRDINKEEYKSILRRAVPQVTNSSSAIDPERIRSLVKKYVAKIKGQRVDS